MVLNIQSHVARFDPTQFAHPFRDVYKRQALIELGVGNVVIKLGKQGCYIQNRQLKQYCPTYNVTPVDTTGAGDNFVAGMISGILRGKSFPESIDYANACGSLNTTQLGATGAIQSMGQVEAFMQRTKRLL